MVGVGGNPDSLPTRLAFPLKSLQNETVWLPYYSLGACGIAEIPERAGTSAASGPTATARLLAALNYALSRWPFPLKSESQECGHLVAQGLYQCGLSYGAWDKGCGRPQDSGGFWECIFASPNSSCPSCMEFSSISFLK